MSEHRHRISAHGPELMLEHTGQALLALLETGAGWAADGEAVDELTHALQAATLALASGADAGLIVAALFHDIGRFPQVAGPMARAPHEDVGARFCAEMFGEHVAWLVQMHVHAKRFLVATQPTYSTLLSSTSARTLLLQGGPMTPAEVDGFRRHRWAHAAVRLRGWDDEAKVPGAPTRPLATFGPYLARVLGRE
jgi:predicted HD phosphohydrolase